MSFDVWPKLAKNINIGESIMIDQKMYNVISTYRLPESNFIRMILDKNDEVLIRYDAMLYVSVESYVF